MNDVIQDAKLMNLDFENKIAAAAKILGYRSLPPTIDQFIHDPYYLGEVCRNLYPFWKDKLKLMYPTRIHNAHPISVLRGGIGCISGDTKIRLCLKRASIPIKSLYLRYPNGGFYVYSWDIKCKRFSPGLVTGVYYTGKKKVCKVTFSIEDSDNSFSIECTLDHKFLLTSGIYVEAQDLEVDNGIQSLYEEKRVLRNSAKVHRVISVEFLDKELEVYDMTVDKYHNYGIEDGEGNLIFTHNTGKSTVSRICALYTICRIFHLKNPYDTFRIMPGKNLKFSFFSYTSGLAGTDFIDVIWEWIESSPYFQEEVEKGKFSIIEMVADGTRGNSNIGSDVLGYVLSEINFVNYGKAYEKLDQALKRFDSRFGRFQDFFGYIILDSSSRGDDSIVDAFVNDNPYRNVLVINSNQWKVREHLNYYGQLGWFKIYLGDSVHSPFIISDRKPFVPGMDEDRVLEVPEELRADFEFDIISAIQDKAGISTNTSDRLFPDTSNLIACFDLPNYVGEDVVKFDFYNKTDKLIYRFDRALKSIPDDKIIFIRYDIGTVSDNTGLAIAYFDKWKIYDRSKNVKQPEIIIPLACGISRFEGSETPIYHLYEFIIDLNERFEVGMFTADQYASKQLLQDLTREGIPNAYLSVDRTDEAYILTKTLANNGLLHINDNKLLKNELADLRRIGNKIDHVALGSKDIADAVAGVIQNLYDNLDKAGQLSNKYRITTHTDWLKERMDTPESRIQEMLNNLY